MAMPEPTSETPPRHSSKPGDNVVRLRRDPDPAQRDRTLCEAILESASDYAIITIDPIGLVTSWNAGARNLLGWEEAEALGMDGRLLFTPEDRERGAPEAEMAQARQAGQDTSGGGGRRLRLLWEEQGGPEVRPPAAVGYQGFGTRLVAFAAAHELHGRAELTFAPEGLQAEIAFPIG